MYAPGVTETAFRVLPVQPEPYPAAEAEAHKGEVLWSVASVVPEGWISVFYHAAASASADVKGFSLAAQFLGGSETFAQREAPERLPSFAEYMRQIQAWAQAYDREPVPMTPEEFEAILDQVCPEEADL